MSRLPVFLTLCLLTCGLSALPLTVNAQGETETDPFDAVHAYAGVTVYLRQGDTEKIRVTGRPKDLEGLVTETRGTVLHIYYEKLNEGIRFMDFGSERRAKVYVQAVELNAVKVSSGADVIGESVIRSKSLEVESSSGADVKLEVAAGKLVLSASSGADMVISGEADEAEATASSGSDISAGDLRVRSAYLRASSGSDIKMTVTREVDAAASSGGDITVKGNPKIRKESESSGGDVRVR